MERDVAVVLSGGAINGILLELGFLKRLRESELWPRVGAIYGTSAGALSGTMAAINRLDAMEEFMLLLQPDETFRAHSLWRLPLLGSHDFRLPDTVDERLGDIVEITRELARSPIEVIVFATDVTDDFHSRTAADAYELSYSSHEASPETMAAALFASAAVPALVLPRPVEDRIATDGAWVRNFPLAHAYARPGVELIVSFRYLPSYPRAQADWMPRVRRRLERFSKVPPVKALLAELNEAEARVGRDEPAHWGDMIARLMRVAVQQNTVVEEAVASERDEALAALDSLRSDVDAIIRREGGRRGDRVARAVADRFAEARLPFIGERRIPRIAVQSGAGDVSLEAGLRRPTPWPDEAKRALIARGYALLDEELAVREVA